MTSDQQQPMATTFQHLSIEELVEIDKAAGAILDNGFGELTIKWEYMAIKWITSLIPKKISVPRKAA